MNREITVPLWVYVLLFAAFWASGALLGAPVYDLLRLTGRQLRALWQRLRKPDLPMRE